MHQCADAPTLALLLSKTSASGFNMSYVPKEMLTRVIPYLLIRGVVWSPALKHLKADFANTRIQRNAAACDLDFCLSRPFPVLSYDNAHLSLRHTRARVIAKPFSPPAKLRPARDKRPRHHAPLQYFTFPYSTKFISPSTIQLHGFDLAKPVI